MPKESTMYQIRVRGVIGPQWSTWFDGLTITPQSNGETSITGPVVDQAALHGILIKIRDMNLEIVSIVQVDQDD